MSEHPNAARAREGFERFEGDLPALLDLFADDAVWHVPGSRALSGEHRGRDAIIAFLRGTAERTGGTFVYAQPLDQPAFDVFWAG